MVMRALDHLEEWLITFLMGSTASSVKGQIFMWPGGNQ